MKTIHLLPKDGTPCIRKSICTGEESLVFITQENKQLELGSYRTAKEKVKLLNEYGLENTKLKEIF
ncbi:MAG: hypothetical protein GX903_04620 [Spirochaetales bacterium]|nr:hypothetical protein [Spirochaetales bacterium]